MIGSYPYGGYINSALNTKKKETGPYFVSGVRWEGKRFGNWFICVRCKAVGVAGFTMHKKKYRD